jgi:hypothetical protein
LKQYFLADSPLPTPQFFISHIWGKQMSDFTSQPPSKKVPPSGTFFRGGMMPVPEERGNSVGLIVFDLKSLKLSIADGKAIETLLLDTLYKELARRGIKLETKKAANLGNTLGISIE